MAVVGFCAAVRAGGNLGLALVAGTAGATFGYLMWRPNGFGWRDEAYRQDRIDRGEPAFDDAWAKRAMLWVVGGFVVVFGLLVLTAH